MKFPDDQIDMFGEEEPPLEFDAVYGGQDDVVASVQARPARKKYETAGLRFGRLVAVRKTERKQANVYLWECVCDCGGVAYAKAESLRSGRVKSCGCLNREIASKRIAELHKRVAENPELHGYRTHGMSRTPTYKTWATMWARCVNPNEPSFAKYGARGISVCERWRSFENFLADMGVRPAGKTLDRIDNSAGYSPDNCRWATAQEQARNRRSNRPLTVNGETKLLSDWARVCPVTFSGLRSRIDRGWDPERAVFAPSMAHGSGVAR